MKSFKKYLSEEVLSAGFSPDIIAFYEDILKEMKRLGKAELIYRGFNTDARQGGATYVKNNRSNFYGSIDPNAKALMKELDIKNPAFGAREELKARMFGTTWIFVPKGKFKAWQSESHVDLLSGFPKDVDHDIEAIADTYVNTLKNINPHEIIFDTKEYYLISINWLLEEIDKGNRFQKYKPKDVKNYNDLYNAIKSVVSFMKWKKKN